MRIIPANRSLGALAFCALVACSGGGGTAPGSSPQATLSNGRLVLAIPLKSTDSRGKSRDFLSPSVASAAISITGIAEPVVADLTATSSQCTTSGATRTCSIAIAAPTGADTFTVTLYAGAGATGAILGTGTATQQIAPDAPFSVAIGVNGTVATIQLIVARKQFAAGAAATTAITVNALDAGGNVIEGEYASPIAITDSDTSGTFTVSPATVGSSSTVVTLSYSGGTTATSATISATGMNVPQASVSALTVTVGVPTSTPTPTPTATPTPPPTGCVKGSHLYVNDDDQGVVSYAFPITSNSVPTTIHPQDQNVWIAFDPSAKNLYITSFFSAINQYPAPYTGSATASYPDASDNDPYGVAVNAQGNVFIAEAEADVVIELSSITGSTVNRISVAAPYALALDSAGDLYIGGSNGVTEYAPPYNEANPTKTITSVTNTQGIAFDAKGDLFAGGNNEIEVFAPPYTGKPFATITTGLATPLGLAVDCNGNVYAPNYGNNTITAYAPPYTAGPFATLPGGLPDSDAIGP